MQQSKRRNGAESQKFTPRKAEPELLPLPSTVQELIALGDQAANALKNPVLRHALDHSIREIQNQWFESAPEEKQKRDFLYQQGQSLKRTYEMLNRFMNEAMVERDRLNADMGH